MEKQEVIEALKRLKENSQKRNFKQSIELIINLKGIDLKKQDNQISIFANLPYDWGKKVSICGLVGAELKSQAEGICDETILVDNFQKYNDKKLLKKLAKKHDFFIAQANIMPQVATTFGRILGPLGKMPNPKIGCVLPPNGNVKAVYERLQKTKRLMSKNNPIIQCSVGIEEMKNEEVADNIMAVYDALIHALPNEKHNIKSAYLKLTMSKAIMIGRKPEEKGEKKEKGQIEIKKGKISGKKPEEEPIKESRKEEPIKKELEKTHNKKQKNNK